MTNNYILRRTVQRRTHYQQSLFSGHWSVNSFRNTYTRFGVYCKEECVIFGNILESSISTSSFLCPWKSDIGLGIVAHDCNSAIGGQGQSVCTYVGPPWFLIWTADSVRTKLYDVYSHLLMGLVKFPHFSVPWDQTRPTYYQWLWCLTSASGAYVHLNPGEGGQAYRLLSSRWLAWLPCG